MSKVKLYQTSGDVIVKSNEKKRKVKAEVPEAIEDIESLVDLYGENTIPINDSDVIITEADSYAINIQDENDPDYTAVSLFPNSKAKVSVNGKEITDVELYNGLFRIETKNPIHLPLAEIEYLDDSTHFFYIDVKDSQVSISLVSGHAEITHSESGKKVKLQMKEQATLTPDGIEGPLEVEQKFKDAYKKQREFESRFYDLYDDASLIQQKAYISNMEENIAETKQEIREIKEEGGQPPAQMVTGLHQMEREVKKTKRGLREELEKKSQKKEKQKEVSEFQKKFNKREEKFAKELEQMSKEVSTKTSTSGKATEMTDLEKKIQAAGSDIQKTSTDSGSSDEMSDLEKKIQAAGEELDSAGASTSESGDSDDDLTDLEKKIQAAGEDSEEK